MSFVKHNHLHLHGTKHEAVLAWKQFHASSHEHTEWRALGVDRYNATVRCMETKTDTIHYFMWTSDPQWMVNISGMEYQNVTFSTKVVYEDIKWALTRLRGH